MNRETPPYVSVIMAVYNGETYLRDTVSSILNQTFRDFEYIIVNDGSTDNTENILARFTDSRIIVIRNEQNRGLAYSLNKGLAIAQGNYIARIDAGDLAVPDRLEKQVTFLDQHPEIGIVGSYCSLVDEISDIIGIARVPLQDLEIRWISLLTNPFIHPSVMFRRDILCQYHLSYEPTFQASQDYELWTRLLEYTQGANLEDVLTVYRICSNSITSSHRNIQFQNQDIVILRTLQKWLPELSISQKQVGQLRETFIGGFLSKQEREIQSVRLAWLYLELLGMFAKKYGKHPDIKALQQRETLRIALMAFRLPFFSSWLAALRRAVRLYPGSVYPLLRYIVKKHIWKKMWRFMRRHYTELRKERML
jgi:glycosyltransferase involved in cell wall biosynthesis